MASNKTHSLWLLSLLLSVLILCYIWRETARQGDQSIERPSKPTISYQPGTPPRHSGLTASGKQTPAYLPKGEVELQEYSHNFEQGTEYVITGRVTTEKGEALPGAIVLLHSSKYKPPKFEWPAPISREACDNQGRYSIRLSSPMTAYVLVGKEGYAQIYDVIDFLDPGTIVKDYHLWRAACVEGYVFDNNGNPIAGAEVNSTLSSPPPDGSLFAPIKGASGPSGKYSLNGIPEGPVSVGAKSQKHLYSVKFVSVKSGDCKRLDFRLSEAYPFSFVAKNSMGVALPDAIAWTSEGANLSNERGEIEFAVSPGSGPLKCWVTAKGYKTKTLLLDPKSPPPVVVLEIGRAHV